MKETGDDALRCAQSAAISLRMRQLAYFRCMAHQDEGGITLQRPRCSTSLGEFCGPPSLFEATLSAFPFVLPMGEPFRFHTSDVVFTAGALDAQTVESQRYPMFAAATENISAMAADLALEMGELRHSGERLARLLPMGTFPPYVGSADWPSRSEDRCRKRYSACTGGKSPLVAAELWCDCVASVAASIESSMLSVLYEKEALLLLHQDLLHTKFQWWRAVKTLFTKGTHAGTLNPFVSQATRQKRHRPRGEFCTQDIERLLPGGVTAYETTARHALLQRWASCCFYSQVSLAYLAKAHDQLYCVSDGSTGPSLQSVSRCGRIGFETNGTLPNSDALRPNTDTGENERREGDDQQKLGSPSRPDTFHKAGAGLLDLEPIALHKATDSGPSAAPQLRACRGDTEKRRQIWQWIWEAAGALGFCASSRFLAMQLLDAYLQEVECTVDISKTAHVATAAVAAVLLAAASRCHWENVRDDAFLTTLLKQLELPSTVDDVIQLQADMLRLLPSFLFSRRSPVDFLVCFISNLRWLPQMLEHSSAVGLTCNQVPGCRSTEKRLTTTEAHAGRKDLSNNSRAPGQPLHNARSASQSCETWSREDGFPAREQTAGVGRWHASRGGKDASEIQPSACRAAVASLRPPRDTTFFLRTCAASPAPTSEKRAVSLFEYWKFTGLLGCLEGLMLRCCSAFIASAALCTRVPVSRLLAVLLLELFEPYSWYRLRHQDGRATVTSLGQNSKGIEAGPFDESEQCAERTKSFVWLSGGKRPLILLQWYRYVSVSVFRMHFDADLSFWKQLLQPLTDQLLHLPENKPFLLLWKRGAEEWTALLKGCLR